ncbi:ATP-dependent helicase HepA [Corynebacterium atrinae]|uniref:helicase-related protein n=1 Tax=Corynebacterium atrinae TaxID=1336740 RepID=UPI0025B3AD85|nr:helicase-related protein [Corynebacterium atrinae]WJY64502.1 ATP-dependent helicase HepA [Corynebacterium atrinae]
MTRILDNLSDDTTMGNHARTMFKAFDRLDVATGYFNLRGWSLFCDIVDLKISANRPLPVARVLIGMVQGSAHQEVIAAYQREIEGEEDVTADREIAVQRRKALLEILRGQLMRGIPTNTDRQTLAHLQDQIKAGAVEIRVFCDQPLHGKAYIFHRDDPSQPTMGLVGSSNLTYPGMTSNLELNTDVVDADGAEKLSQWFEGRWNDDWSLPIGPELLDLLEESWASPTPRPPQDVFLKVCYDMSRDVREGLDEYSLTGRISDELLEYQATAVKTLARRVMMRGGTMLGDVVGLGKTLTAIAVALMLRDEYGYQPLVICPKNLQTMWEEHLGAYDLHGRVVPYSMSHSLNDLRRYPFVIVDESHTLRNEKTQTYQNVQRYIMTNDSKALLLTATPFNIKYSDVANQLGLFIDDDEDLGLQPLAALSKANFAENIEFGLSTLAAFRKSDESEDWKRLMGEHLVRRTRSFVKENYASTNKYGQQYLNFSNGQQFLFPKRIAKPVDHQFHGEDPAALMVEDMTLDTIASLKLPRYDLYSYVSPAGKKQATPEEVAILEDLERSRGHVSGFVRTNFYKRLSSCGHSFILSLKRHFARNQLFMYAIDEELPIPVGTIDANVLRGDSDSGEESSIGSRLQTAGDSAEEYERVAGKPSPDIRWVRPSLFVSRLRDELESDNRAISYLLSSYGPWTVENDSKLRALLNLVKTEHPGEKILVFTEYKDTANYLASALRQVGVENVGLATGDTDDPTAVARRFSPKSNAKLVAHNEDYIGEMNDELHILVATDVLSEGQNLQDAHIVVNYDIPWAIIQLIQRAGRVDRVGQEAGTVLIYTISHGSVEDVLNLRQRVQQRLAANAATFGSDESFFDTEEEVAIIRDLYNGHIDDISHEDDVDASSLAYEIWNKATKNDADLADRIARLPDMIDATRAFRLSDQRCGVAAHVQTESGMDLFGWASKDGEMHLLTGHEALRIFESTPFEPGLVRSTEHDSLVRELVKSGPLKEQNSIAGRLRGERKILWNRLGNQLNLIHDPATDQALDALFQRPLTKLATNRLRSARRRGANDVELLELLRTLHIRDDLVIQTRSGKDQIHIVSVMGIAND